MEDKFTQVDVTEDSQEDEEESRNTVQSEGGSIELKDENLSGLERDVTVESQEEEVVNRFEGITGSEASPADGHLPLWEPSPEDIELQGWFKSYFHGAPDKLFGLHKWAHYMNVYEKHLTRFRGKHPVILEVGVAKGGSIEMWNRFFGGECTIYGVDLMRKCHVIAEHFSNVHIYRGDQADPSFWEKFREICPKVDILLEDGGHKMHQQIQTFECMYDHVKDNGIYLCEDLCTSYRPEYGGALGKSGTFVEYAKTLIDRLNAYHIRSSTDRANTEYPLDFRRVTASITFYDGVVVFEKCADNEEPYGTLQGGVNQCVWCNRILSPQDPPHEKLKCQAWLRERFP